MDPGIYIFCLSNTQCPDFPGSSCELDRLFLHRHGNLCAIAKRVSLEEFCGPEADRRLADPAWVTPRAIDHGRVIAEVFRSSPVLPVPFGTLFSSPRVLEDFLERNANLIEGFFEYAADCEEWGIKALLERSTAHKWLRAQIAVACASSGAPASAGLRYIQQRQSEAAAEKQLQHWLLGACESIARSLDDCASDRRQRAILDPAIPDDSRELVLNLAALIPRERREDLFAHIENSNAERAEQGLSFVLNGPWPPYSFYPPLVTP